MPGRQWRVISARKGERSSEVLAHTAKLHLANKRERSRFGRVNFILSGLIFESLTCPDWRVAAKFSLRNDIAATKVQISFHGTSLVFV